MRRPGEPGSRSDAREEGRVDEKGGETGRQNQGWAVVTGASSGIGWELARNLAAEGWDLVITARRQDALEALAREARERWGREVHVVPADLAGRPGVEHLLEALERLDLEPDILVNNAGFGDYGSFEEAELDRVLQMIELNVSSLTHLTRVLLPGMLERGRGRILNVASTAAFQPGPLMAVYYATKSYVLSFSEALREEARGTGVTITTLCPGPTTSEFHAEAGMMASPLVQRFPMPGSRQVAEYGVRALMKGKGVAVYGVLNRLHVFGLRFLPRSLVLRLVRRVQEIRS